MDHKRHFFITIWLIFYSTIAYYLPLMVFDLNAIDFESVPKDFYSFYCFFIAFNFSLVFMYALALFVVLPLSDLKTKLLVLWLVVAELSTLIDFILRKYFLIIHHSDYQMVATLVVFGLFCSFFLHRALSNKKSDKFNPEKTYIIKYKPKNWYGILNYIWKIAGHGALYQDGKIYKFRKKSKRVEPVNKTDFQINKLIKSGGMTIHETPRRENINDLVGSKYSLLKFNCNHLTKDA